MSLPYFRLYPTDFEADTSHLTLAEDGAYNRLLRLCWMTPGCSLPNDEAWIMRRMRVRSDEEKEVVRTILAEFFTVEKQRVSNPRLTREYQHSTERSNSASKNGAKGGRPAKPLKTNETKKAKGSVSVSEKKANQNQNQIDTSLQEDAGASLWGEGLKILLRLGVKERQARTIIGKWRKAHGDGDTLKALLAAGKAEASDPIPYVERVLRGDSRNRPVSDEEHAAAWGMRNANHDGDSGRTADHGRQEPSRRPADDLPGMQQPPQATEPEAALSVGDVQAGRDRGALPSLRLVGGEAF